jgi:hypothetical protein
MRRFALVMALLAAAVVASAQTADDAEKLKAFHDINALSPATHEFHLGWHFGYVQSMFRMFGMDWRITAVYLPLLPPLPGARLEDGAKIPNPFELTGTPYASTMPPMFDKDRSWAVEREYRRIERLTAKAQY